MIVDNRTMGLKIIIDNTMMVEGDPYLVRRGFCERFFSRPWRPLEGWKWIKTYKPSPEVIKGEDNYLIMHSATKKALYGHLVGGVESE